MPGRPDASAARYRLPSWPGRLTVEIMTRASGAASRAAAARATDDLLAQRAERFRERETQLRRMVIDYHHAAAQARKIYEDAQARAEKIAADTEARIAALRERADEEASVFRDTANVAVRAMLQCGEPRTAVASLTMLTIGQVRAIERTQPSTTTRRHAARPPDQETPPSETAQ